MAGFPISHFKSILILYTVVVAFFSFEKNSCHSAGGAQIIESKNSLKDDSCLALSVHFKKDSVQWNDSVRVDLQFTNNCADSLNFDPNLPAHVTKTDLMWFGLEPEVKICPMSENSRKIPSVSIEPGGVFRLTKTIIIHEKFFNEGVNSIVVNYFVEPETKLFKKKKWHFLTSEPFDIYVYNLSH